jgi:hypothetical protein
MTQCSGLRPRIDATASFTAVIQEGAAAAGMAMLHHHQCRWLRGCPMMAVVAMMPHRVMGNTGVMMHRLGMPRLGMCMPNMMHGFVGFMHRHDMHNFDMVPVLVVVPVVAVAKEKRLRAGCQKQTEQHGNCRTDATHTNHRDPPKLVEQSREHQDKLC